jgi:hypothetical protein
MDMSRYVEQGLHHEIWVYDGFGMPLRPEIEEWLKVHAGKKWLGSCGFSGIDGRVSGTFYNFSDKKTAMLFKLTWG